MSNINQFMIKPKFISESLSGVASQDTYALSTISIPNSDQENCMILINGRKQNSPAFTLNSPTSITFSETLEGGEIIEVIIVDFK